MARCASTKPARQSIKFTEGAIHSATVSVDPAGRHRGETALTASTVTPVAGASVTLTTTAQDTYGNTVTTYTGSKSLTFSGASAEPRRATRRR